ncbi:tripartite tricarboxylate transporter TctB family protein [Ancylobacter sp. MQZ15Z-1]|uniref:Tripartite tricarboxylate transporter TctB family protein n=1 Tax=Ancylobacter mangrovi TaxID=2972472 RepID=A0A9X2T4S5_9HYPH|nr:tripartite tricarboxylate transporter TctB family protein [Ancylobacter mangrovi]MCS0494664.1 tripartite tricarboxylate transporter TctB family protein [Ancylobacter mangrovi]
MSEHGFSGHGRRGDVPTLLIGAFLLLLAGLTVYDASHLRQPMTDVGVGPSTFPMLIAAGLAVLGLLTLKSAFGHHTVNLGVPNAGALPWILGGLVANIVLLDTAGFTLATGVMFALSARAFARKSFLVLLPAGILAALAAYIGFRFGLQLSLPEGPLEALL